MHLSVNGHPVDGAEGDSNEVTPVFPYLPPCPPCPAMEIPPADPTFEESFGSSSKRKREAPQAPNPYIPFTQDQLEKKFVGRAHHPTFLPVG